MFAKVPAYSKSKRHGLATATIETISLACMISSRSFGAVIAILSSLGIRHIALADLDNVLSNKLVFTSILPNKTRRHLPFRRVAKQDPSCGMHDDRFDVILKFRQLRKVVWPSHSCGTYSLCITVSHE